jgi:hypothetical protein
MNCEWCGELTDVKKLRATIFHLQLRIEELEKQSFESVELLMKGEALRSKMISWKGRKMRRSINWIDIKKGNFPPDNQIKLLNVHWFNSLDSGDQNDFGFIENGVWYHFDKHKTKIELKASHMNLVVTHWSEQPKGPFKSQK